MFIYLTDYVIEKRNAVGVDVIFIDIDGIDLAEERFVVVTSIGDLVGLLGNLFI